MGSKSLLLVIVLLPWFSNAYGEESFLPQIGKFRNCSFDAQCEQGSECGDLPRCDHLRSSERKCTEYWKTKSIGFGIKTKIPEIKCKEVSNKAYFDCQRSLSLERSKCEERKRQTNNQCLENAAKQTRDCEAIKSAEINLANDLLDKLKAVREYLETYPYDKKTVVISKPDLNGKTQFSMEIKVIQAKDYSKFWSYFYDKSKFPDWNLIPSVGYSQYREFFVIEDIVVMSPKYEGNLNNKMLAYAAAITSLTSDVGLDGISQLYSLEPEIVEKYAASIAAKASI